MNTLSYRFFIVITCFVSSLLYPPPHAFAEQVVLRERTLVPIKTTAPISSKNARLGMEITSLVVERDIKVNGSIAIKQGQVALARVTELKKTQMAGISGSVGVTVEYTTGVDGTVIPLKGSFNYSGESEVGGTVAIGIIICPFAFLNRGKEGIIPAGAVIRTITEADRNIEVN